MNNLRILVNRILDKNLVDKVCKDGSLTFDNSTNESNATKNFTYSYRGSIFSFLSDLIRGKENKLMDFMKNTDDEKLRKDYAYPLIGTAAVPAGLAIILTIWWCGYTCVTARCCCKPADG